MLLPVVVNAHDMGREIQLSYYSGPKVYNPPTEAYPDGACDKLFGGVPWPWNPIGAGDVDGNHGQILSFTKTVSSWHILTQPLQWACHNVSCDCTFEQWGTLTRHGRFTVILMHPPLHPMADPYGIRGRCKRMTVSPVPRFARREEDAGAGDEA